MASLRNKFYLTQKGLSQIKKKYNKLLDSKREIIEKGAPEALHSDQLSSEFISFRQKLEDLEARIRELEYILKNYELIKSPSSKERSKVCIGAKVVVEIESKESEFELVDTVEADPGQGKISIESPVGKALLGGKAGEEVSINYPRKIYYKIKKIEY